MAENGAFSAISWADVTDTKEVLNAQQQLLRKLYAELDQEREASETAASEALSMILRLQSEKAAVEIEAKQYKRMVEEKLNHANECLKIFEEVIYQKDIEIASLQCQIQAYKYKMLSLGSYARNCGETAGLESTFLRRIESMSEEGTSGDEEVNMIILLTQGFPIVENEKARANSVAWTENATLFKESKSTDVDQEMKVESGETQDIGSSYWQQIKKLDERVKGISNGKEFRGNNSYNSTCTSCSSESINALNTCLESVEKQPEILQETCTIVDSVCSSSVQDIFEVPKVSGSHIGVAGKQKVETEEDIAGREIEIILLEPDSPTVIKSLFKTEPKSCFDSILEEKMCKSSRRKNLDHYNIPCASSAVSNAESRSEMIKLNKRIERLEQATNGLNSRQASAVVGKEELTSLKELINKIQIQLSTIQTDVNFFKTSKSQKCDDSVLRTLQEELLHLWL